jgi:hypothetical protein
VRHALDLGRGKPARVLPAYPQAMSVDPNTNTPGDRVDERGVLITAEGRARVRQRLAELDAQDPAGKELRRQDALRRLRRPAAA